MQNQEVIDDDSDINDYYAETANNSDDLEKRSQSTNGDDFENQPPEKQQPKPPKRSKNKGLKYLHQMLKANKDEILRVKIFQSTMNTIRQSLKSQALFLSDFINKDMLEL